MAETWADLTHTSTICAGITATVLHDRPPAFFGPSDTATRHALFTKLRPALQQQGVEEAYCAYSGVQVGEGETIFTALGKDGKPRLRSGAERPALFLSSTSWTPDEDFSILLEALTRLCSGEGEQKGVATRSSKEGAKKRPPFVVVAVTGKGPQKAMYEEKMRQLDLKGRMAICTLWLEAQDYPRLVGAADLGVCLHTSTSGEGSLIFTPALVDWKIADRGMDARESLKHALVGVQASTCR